MSLVRRKKAKESPSTSAQGSVFIPGRDPYLLEYRKDLVVKDVVEGVCRHLELLPVTWPFFGICPMHSDLYLYPYDIMSEDDFSKQYRLRVMVNVGPNCFHFKYLDDKAFNLFFDQVREDCIQGRLGMPMDCMWWMAGIDMARKAQEEKIDYKGLLQKYKHEHFLPKCCLKKLKRTRKVVLASYDKFCNSSNPLSDGKLKLKYLEIAEKSSVMEYHTCSASMESDQGRVMVQLIVSVKKGIEKEVIVNDSGPPQPRVQLVPELSHINFIETSYRTPGHSTVWIARVVCRADAQGLHEHHFWFEKKEELASFCIVVDTLCTLTVNCNVCIVEGSLKPRDRYLKITEKDPHNSKICHGLISRDAVSDILSQEGMEDGLYLVRKSRQRMNSYTLHVCLHQRVRNFEVKLNEEGKLYILPNATFESLLKLVYHYHKDKHGLPVPLLRILPPEKTRAIPLLDKDLRKGGNLTSPDANGKTSPAFPFPVEPASSSGCSSSSSDSCGLDSDSGAFNLAQLPLPNGVTSDINGHRAISDFTAIIENGGIGTSNTWQQHTTFSVSHTRSFMFGSQQAPPVSTLSHLNTQSNSLFLSSFAPDVLPSPTPIPTRAPLNPPVTTARSIANTPVLTIDHTKLERGRELGQGHFSHVYIGKFTDNQHHTHQVAIKVLKKKSIHDHGVAEQELLKEADNMGSLHHEHIVKFLGISHSPEDELMLITEFVPLGDLRKYLKRHKDQRQEIPVKRLIKFSIQIAEGMNYLESMRIVHRDLAARNILVKDDSCVKISDFGLARQLNLQENSDYYRVHDPRNASLPLWWYAPESICDWKFTSANDVWSFGVTLWEIFSYGGTPKLEDIEANDRMEIYRHLRNGKRLKRPKLCPVEVHQLMTEHCWKLEPQNRMKFDGLAIELYYIDGRL